MRASRRRLARLADRLRRARALLHAGRAALPGARRARRRSDRAAGQRALSGAAGLARAAHSAKLSDDLTAAGYHPFPAPSAVMLNEADMAYSRCIRCQTCDGFPCLVHAKSDAEVIAVRPALEHPNVTLLRNARALRLETERRGHGGHRGHRRGRRARTETLRGRHRRRLLRRGQLRRAAAALGQRQASERPRQRLRSGRPQLHVPQQPGGAGAVADDRTTRCSRRRWR